MCQVVNAGIHPSLVDTFGRRCRKKGPVVWLLDDCEFGFRQQNICHARVLMHMKGKDDKVRGFFRS